MGESRHKFQDEAVEMTGQILELYKASLEERISACRSNIAQAEHRCHELQAAAQQSQSDADAARNSADKSKRTLADDARAFQAAKTAMNDAERLAAEGEKELKAAASKKADVEKLLQNMDSLHEDQGQRRIKDFAGRVERLVEVDSSMMTAIPCVFSKEPSTRGQFDLMLIQQLTEKVHKAIAKFDDVITSGATAEAERAAVVETAKAVLLEARQKQIEAARASTSAFDAAKAADEVVQKMKSEIVQAKKVLKETTETATEAEVDLDLFCQEVLQIFGELRDRTTVTEEGLTEAAGSPVPNVLPNAAPGSPSLVTVPALIEVSA